MSLEITFLTTEANFISVWLPAVIETLEDDESVAWAKGFPFDVRNTSPTNLWTKGANEFSSECVGVNGPFNLRKGPIAVYKEGEPPPAFLALLCRDKQANSVSVPYLGWSEGHFQVR